MIKQKNVNGSIRLPADLWPKFRALLRYKNEGQHVKNTWLTKLIETEHEKMMKQKGLK